MAVLLSRVNEKKSIDARSIYLDISHVEMLAQFICTSAVLNSHNLGRSEERGRNLPRPVGRQGTISAFARSDFEKPRKADIRLAGPEIDPRSGRIPTSPGDNILGAARRAREDTEKRNHSGQTGNLTYVLWNASPVCYHTTASLGVLDDETTTNVTNSCPGQRSNNRRAIALARRRGHLALTVTTQRLNGTSTVDAVKYKKNASPEQLRSFAPALNASTQQHSSPPSRYDCLAAAPAEVHTLNRVSGAPGGWRRRKRGEIKITGCRSHLFWWLTPLPSPPNPPPTVATLNKTVNMANPPPTTLAEEQEKLHVGVIRHPITSPSSGGRGMIDSRPGPPSEPSSPCWRSRRLERISKIVVVIFLLGAQFHLDTFLAEVWQSSEVWCSERRQRKGRTTAEGVRRRQTKCSWCERTRGRDTRRDQNVSQRGNNMASLYAILSELSHSYHAVVSVSRVVSCAEAMFPAETGPDLTTTSSQNQSPLEYTATAHTARTTIARIESVFQPDRVISRGTNQPAPHRSPDLSVCHSFLWGALKGQVYSNNPHTLEELQANIITAMDAIPQHVLARAFHNFWCRLHICLEVNGGHFQHLF
ncbi:hypothetical protein PR048_029226 [Dryococelus australis]|uniref:Uncharacterized protein n=1 Tax=Dryococelus australis TaxID=614101 RepID=A0ABQ9GCS1_9NEOP|nr:hypothetical protein PR048_029226 [Dryococelus australis]